MTSPGHSALYGYGPRKPSKRGKGTTGQNRKFDVTVHMKLVHRICQRFKRACNAGLDYDDLFQYGMIGLMRAAETYDETKGFKISTYSSWWIRQTIQRAISDAGRTVRIPCHAFTDFRQRGEPLPAATVSYNTPQFYGESGHCADWVESFASEGPSPEDMAIEAERSAIIDECIDSLDTETSSPTYTRRDVTRHAEVVRARFYEEETLEKVGARFGVTRERSRQVEGTALARLKGRLEHRLRKDDR